MKTRLLMMLIFFGIVSANAQTTYNLNWQIGANGPDMDITVDVGDTVIWTWTDGAPHTVENVVGSSVETFNSGTISGNGMSYSYTFTVEGINDYFCGIHGATSMNGRITVQSSATTYNLNWQIGANGTDMDITINSGDTVIWTWTDGAPHTVENVVGSSVETFDSGTLSGVGQTFSYTFTVVGINDYFCGIHGATSMNGRITVEPALSVAEESFIEFNIVSNPVKNELIIQLPPSLSQGKLSIHDVLGKEILVKDFNDNEALRVNVSTLNQGLYLVTIESGSLKQTKRFIKN